MDQKYTKYERARIIGARALQISAGAPILIRNLGEKDPISIAMQEFDEGIIPITVNRANKDQHEKSKIS